jgi:ribosomal protein S18 acetylase RimI-like enzyme
MKVTLEKATIKDCPVIAELARNIWMKHYIEIISLEQIAYMLDKMYSAQSLEEQMQKGHHFFFIKDGDVKKGYVSISLEKDKSCFLHKFYIDTGDQNKGIGSAAFGLLLDEMKGANLVRLGVNRANYKSINFYFKLGFRIEKMLNAAIGSGFTMDDFIMTRELVNE